MQKNIINIVIIIAVFLGFYFLYSYLAPESETGNRWMFRKEVQNPPYDEVLKNSADQAEKDIAIYNEAIKNRSSELCLTIGDIGQKKSCLDMIGATLALDEKNIEKCSVLSSSGMIVRCQDNIYYSLSTEKNNKESCRSIQDENIAKNCIESVEKSLFVLANASGSISSSICATFESSIAGECQRLLIQKDDSSIYREAIASRSLTSCDVIADEKLRSVCRDTILFQKAVTDSDISLCAEITDSAKSDTCKSNLGSRSDAMKLQSLISSGTLDDCETLSTSKYRDQCHDMVVIRNVRELGDTSLCDMLIATGTIDRCMKLTGK